MATVPAAPDRPSKGDRTRRRLLDAAASLLARDGRVGVSLSGIAEAAGLRTGSVYFHFGSKDELIATVLEEGLRESLRHLDDALAPLVAADAGARLWAAVRAHLDALVELSDYAAVVLTMPEPGRAGTRRSRPTACSCSATGAGGPSWSTTRNARGRSPPGPLPGSSAICCSGR